jgi:anti-sigma factor (TIGR02949 family)
MAIASATPAMAEVRRFRDAAMTRLDRYTCEDVFRRLDDYVDRELSPPEARLVEDHLATCSACATEYAFEAHVIAELRAKLRRVAVPETLLSRIEATLATARGETDGDWRARMM